MPILSRFLVKLTHPNGASPGALRGVLSAGVVLAAVTASSAADAQQPAAPKPAAGKAAPKPGAAAAPPPTTAPADAPPAGVAGPAAPGAGAPAGDTAPTSGPADAPPSSRGDEPLLPKGSEAPALPPAAAPLMSAAAGAPADADRGKAATKPSAERPTSAGDIGARPGDVYAEDWWSQARPAFEIHGYYRLRAELFHKFSLARRDSPPLFWPQPPDTEYNEYPNMGLHPVNLCGPYQPGTASQPGGYGPCADVGQNHANYTNAGANMRFRVSPELHISDNLRVMSQIDLLDNITLGSTPDSYANTPGAGGGYSISSRGGYSSLGAFATTQVAPTAGINSFTNSINVKRAWGEYTTPVGVVHFGRMPSHWGLGIFANRGDSYDSDFQTTVDRIMLVSGIPRWDLYFAGAWDFANEGATSATARQIGQPYDLGQLDDLNQYVVMVMRRRNPELQRLDLAKGLPVVNGGLYFMYRNQIIANDGSAPTSSASLGQPSDAVRTGYVRRGYQTYTPDLWLQVLYRKFRFELEAVGVFGSMENTQRAAGSPSGDYVNHDDPTNMQNGWKILQGGLAAQSELRAMEDRLRVQLGFGWASGDPDLDTLSPQGSNGLAQLTSNRTLSMFQFHPDYRVDLILYRHLLNGVQGSYYLKPGVEYDFARDRNGQRLGLGASAIWSRASEFAQAPGHARDLGIEIDGQIYYQAKDGSLNDDPDKMGGFFTSIQYGVLFPLPGLGYVGGTPAVETAQTLRWFMGILY
jgi:uncharacterized protein (TIGR04551 family)